MIHEIIREYPGLGSFFYGHWESIELTSTAFLILMGVMLGILLVLVLGGLVGYVLQSVAITKIAKKMGAWRNIRIMACLPFVRYFAIGKLAERGDAVLNTQKRRLWGRLLLAVCCISIPFMVAALLIAAFGLIGTQMFAMVNTTLEMAHNDLVYILAFIVFLPFILFYLVAYEWYALMMVILPIAGILCLISGVALIAWVRVLCGTCYYKVLRTVYAQKTALILTIIGAVTGLSPIVLFVASLKKAE